MANVTIERTNGMVTTLRWEGKEPIQIMCCSDIHFDSPKCDRELLKRHLDLAVERGAKIAIFGDVFDVMGCKADRRMTKDVIRPEYAKGNYLDLVVNDCADFFSPYAESGHLILVGEGNHETAITKHQETDVLTRLVEQLNFRAKSKVIRAGYEGYLLLKGTLQKNSGRISKRLHFHHGYEGGRRSKGALAFDLDRARWDADIYVSGHNHEKMLYPTTRERVNSLGNISVEKVLHMQMGTYKHKDPDEKGSGWATEKKFTHSWLGSYMLHVKLTHPRREDGQRTVAMQFKAEELDAEVW